MVQGSPILTADSSSSSTTTTTLLLLHNDNHTINISNSGNSSSSSSTNATGSSSSENGDHSISPGGLFTNTSTVPAGLLSVTDGIQVDEVVIVTLIVIIWLLAVMAFRRKWDSIRIVQPIESRFKHMPKNLENVKVVKRPQDSIIYKSYSRKMSTTMVAREKRHLQRMHTMPCMNALPSLTALAKPSLPTIQMEEVVTEM